MNDEQSFGEEKERELVNREETGEGEDKRRGPASFQLFQSP